MLNTDFFLLLKRRLSIHGYLVMLSLWNYITQFKILQININAGYLCLYSFMPVHPTNQSTYTPSHRIVSFLASVSQLQTFLEIMTGLCEFVTIRFLLRLSFMQQAKHYIRHSWDVWCDCKFVRLFLNLETGPQGCALKSLMRSLQAVIFG